MESNVILSASLPVPPSTNEANKRNKWGGVYKNEKVTTFREDVYNVIHYYEKALDKRSFGIHRIEELNWPLIEVNRAAYKLQTAKAKKQRKKWRMVAVVFVNEDRRDADNCIKELQDAICKALQINDKCISDARVILVVDREGEPHTEVYIREDVNTWVAGELLRYIQMEKQVGEQYLDRYSSMDRAG